MRPEKPLLLAIIVNGEEHHEVAEILDSKIKHNNLHYLIKWKDLPEGDNEWVKASDCSAPQLTKKFHKKHPGKLGGKGQGGSGMSGSCH